jgi:type IV secretion system protein VirB4
MVATVRNVKKVRAFENEPAFVKYLPYSYHVTDHAISTINGEYLMVFKLRGRTHDCASNADLVHWHRDLNNLFKSIGNEHVKFWTHLHHREVTNFPESEFALSFPRQVDRNYRKSFDNFPLMVNDLYLSVVYNPVGDLTQKFLARFERPSHVELDDMQTEALASLEDIASQLLGAMKPYGIERLGVYYRDQRGARIAGESADEGDDQADTDDLLADISSVPNASASRETGAQFAFSSALEWLGFLANNEASPVPVCRDRIRSYLMMNRPVSSMFGDVMQIRGEESDTYTAAVEIRDYPEETEPGQLNLLMEADFEFLLTQSFCCVSSMAASVFLTNQQKALLETRDKSASQIRQITDANDDVVSRRFIMGWHHGTVHVTANSAKGAQKLARKVRVMLNQCAISASPVGLASEAAYYARLPANNVFAHRPAPINSWNFLSFSPFHNFMSGKPDGNPWGAAVSLFKTTSGTPLFFNFHSTPAGENWLGKRPAAHTIILGKTGAGKTTLMNKLLSDASKFSPRMVCYDKDRGMFPLVMALGGHYTVLRDGEPTGWQPLQLEPTRANILFVKRLVRLLAETSLNRPLDHADVVSLNEAVDAVMGGDASGDALIPHEQRTLTAVAQHIPNPYRTNHSDRATLASLLEPWLRGSEHGWLFDNDGDALNLATHDIFGFDLSDFIVAPGEKSPVARTPLLMYLLYRVRKSIDGTRRFMQVFDEFAQYLDDPIMDVEIKRGLKTDRKKDCVYVFATQEPNDALDSRIGKTIIQQCITKILLENPDADPNDYIKGLNLTVAEFEAMLSIPENSRQFLIKQGGSSALAEMMLKNMDEEISVLSGTPDNSEKLQQIIEQLGTTDPDVWLPVYYGAVVRKSA